MNKIKTVRAYTASNTDEFPEFLSSIIEYDPHGNITMNATYFADDDFESKVISTFDDQNNKTAEITYISDVEIGEHIVFERDADGMLLKEVKSYSDGSQSIKSYEKQTDNSYAITTLDDEGCLEEKEIVKLNDQHHIVNKRVYDENDELKEKFVNEYDDQNRLIKTIESGAKDEFMLQREIIYYNNGNVLQRLSRNRKGELIDSVTYIYDEHNRLIENKIGTRYVVKYQYNDEENSQTEERFLANGIMDSQTVSKFNDQNQIIEEINAATTVLYKYEYWAEVAEVE